MRAPWAAGWGFFRAGLSRVRRYGRILILLWLVNLISAALLSLPSALIWFGASRPTAFERLSDGVDTWLAVEQANLVSGPQSGAGALPLAPAYQGPSAGQLVLLLTLTVLIAIPLAWVSAAFFTGGVLQTYHELPAALSWRRFLSGAWHWFSAFLLLGLLQGLCFIVIALPVLVFALVLAGRVGAWLVWAVVGVAVLVGVLWLALVDLTGAFLIVKHTRNLFRALGEAIAFMVRQPLALLSLYASVLLLLVGAFLVYHFGLLAIIPLSWWPLVFLAWQSLALLELGLRLTRWAGGLAMMAPQVPPQTPPPIGEPPSTEPAVVEPIAVEINGSV